MLCLKSSTDPGYASKFMQNLEEMLVDHAHCEKKAASTALNLLFRYPERADLVGRMAEVVEEEIQHFQAVLALLQQRGWAYRRQRPSRYAGRLIALVRTGDETLEFVDRMLVCALIEARSCERFHVLGAHLEDTTLATFYRSLFESEARHYMTYVRLATAYSEEGLVRARLEEMATAEAELLLLGAGEEPRLHV